MTMKELLSIIGIQQPTSNLMNHPKMLQLLKACNENNLNLYEHDFIIKEEAFTIFLEHIHSIHTLLEILKNTAVLLSMNETPKELAQFYNLYFPISLQYSEDSKILIDDEYLKYATKEWTQKEFLNLSKRLIVSKDHLSLEEILSSSLEEEDFIETTLWNLRALKEAKELHLLKEALQKLSLE